MPVRLGTIVEEWSRQHRYAGISVTTALFGAVLACHWETADKLARALARLDAVVAKHVEAVARHYERQLAALAPYRAR
jgi:hypothetical protein